MAIKNGAVNERGSFQQDASQNGRSLQNHAGGAPGNGLPLHPAWQALIRFCREVGYGEIERIRIQDGLPVSAEVVTKKIRWC